MKHHRGHLKYKSMTPIDFERILIQDGCTMAAILKYLKIALTSLIVVRFSPFFFEVIQNFETNKSYISDL